MKIYYFENEKLKYLFSYLFSHLDDPSQRKIETIKLNSIVEVGLIENKVDNYILFSNFILEDILATNNFIEVLRLAFKKIEIQIVCGGGAHYIVDNESLRFYFPEITHICVGKGEEFLPALFKEKLAPGIYYAKQFGMINRYLVSKEYTLNDSVLLTFEDNRCDWHRCLFCQHQSAYYLPVASPEKIADDIDYYVKECGYLNFTIYDNSLKPEIFHELLLILYNRGYTNIPVKFHLVGLRVDSNIEILEDIPAKWEANPIKSGCWGVEFYDQYVLDLFHKNTKLAQIDKAIDFFYRHNIENHLYILLGLPLVSNTHIENQYQFIVDSSPKVESYLTSFFLLDPGLRIYDQLEEFKIIPGEQYTLQDYFKKKNDVPPIKTCYVKFDSWDEDENSYCNRDEIFKKYKKILGLPKVTTYSKNLFTG
ncbi:MAG: hypothetical protein GY754_41405 [bacterium]|nr:hypothetical protein [bacterium]